MTQQYIQDLPVMISEEELKKRIAQCGVQIESDYAGKRLMIVMIMKGAICFVADLLRELSIDISLEYLRCASYGERGTERGELVITGLEAINVSGEHVLIVDDICDSGNTLHAVASRIAANGAASVKTCALLKRKLDVELHTPDYALFDIESDAFVVGYGLDFKERYRGLPAICDFAGSAAKA